MGGSRAWQCSSSLSFVSVARMRGLENCSCSRPGADAPGSMLTPAPQAKRTFCASDVAIRLMSKPGVLQIISGFIEGGSERQMIQMAQLLRDSGDYEVHAAAVSTGGVLRPEI